MDQQQQQQQQKNQPNAIPPLYWPGSQVSTGPQQQHYQQFPPMHMMPPMPFPMYFPMVPQPHHNQQNQQQIYTQPTHGYFYPPPQLPPSTQSQPSSYENSVQISRTNSISSISTPTEQEPENPQEEASFITRPQINPKFQPGTFVWAKSGRQPYWPGLVVDPNLKECTKALPQLRPDLVLVHFFGTYDYHYVNPVCVVLWEPNQTDRIKKSRSNKFIKACQEVAMANATEQFPPGWDADDMSKIQMSLDRLKQQRPDVAEMAAEENRRISLGLITHHNPGFRVLKKPTNDQRGKKRRELRLSVMRRLGLAAPLFE